jgi:DNA polymerase-3 subunit gamma/tau
MGEIAAAFSEEDLTRYLQLSLDIFKDLQFSLQPRFHLEIGLVRLVQAGRLIPIEQALAGLGPAPRSSAPPSVPPQAAPPREMPPPSRSGPSPFELDRQKKSTLRPPEPQSSGANALAPRAETAPRIESAPQPPEPQGPPPMVPGDPRERLHAWLHENKHAHLADAVENASITIVGGDLSVVAPKSYGLYFKDRGFEDAIREVFGRPLRLKFTPGDAAAPSPISLAAPKAPEEDDAAGRALANPEVQRFRDVFGGEVRKVRNLKE